MENLVGDHLPSSSEIEKHIKAVTDMSQSLERFTCDLTLEERKRAVRFRSGGDNVVELVAKLAEEREIHLGKGASVDDLRNDMTLVERLKPLAQALQTITDRINDTLLEAQSEAWWAATAYYGSLRRAADMDPVLARALQPAVDFFAKKRRGKIAPAPAATTPPASEPNKPTAK